MNIGEFGQGLLMGRELTGNRRPGLYPAHLVNMNAIILDASSHRKKMLRGNASGEL